MNNIHVRKLKCRFKNFSSLLQYNWQILYLHVYISLYVFSMYMSHNYLCLFRGVESYFYYCLVNLCVCVLLFVCNVSMHLNFPAFQITRVYPLCHRENKLLSKDTPKHLLHKTRNKQSKLNLSLLKNLWQNINVLCATKNNYNFKINLCFKLIYFNVPTVRLSLLMNVRSSEPKLIGQPWKTIFRASAHFDLAAVSQVVRAIWQWNTSFLFPFLKQNVFRSRQLISFCQETLFFET